MRLVKKKKKSSSRSSRWSWPFAEIHRSQSKTANQSREEGFTKDNHTHVCAASTLPPHSIHLCSSSRLLWADGGGTIGKLPTPESSEHATHYQPSSVALLFISLHSPCRLHCGRSCGGRAVVQQRARQGDLEHGFTQLLRLRAELPTSGFNDLVLSRTIPTFRTAVLDNTLLYF